MATLEAMSSHHNFRPGQQNKLVSEPPIAAPDEHAQFVEADQRFRAALGQAIAAGAECIEAVEATVQLNRRTKLTRSSVLNEHIMEPSDVVFPHACKLGLEGIV